MKFVVHLAGVVAVLATGSPSRASITVYEQLLDGNSGGQFDPAISGSDIVYADNRAGNNDIFHVDELFLPTALTSHPSSQRQPDVDSGVVAFTDTSGDSGNIRVHDLATSSQFLVTSNLATEDSPAISGSNVVFRSEQFGQGDIRWVDVQTFNIQSITESAPAARFPAIDGAMVAWIQFGGTDFDLWATQLGGTPYLVAGGTGNISAPAVSGSLIAYTNDFDVVVYDDATGQFTQVTDDSYTQQDVVIDAPYVAWSDDRNGNLDVFLYDMTSGQTFALTTAPGQQVVGDIDGNVVVFYDNRFGDLNVWKVTFTITPDCSDGLDNDGDGFIDEAADPGCFDASSIREDPKCQNGIDDDGDGKIDFDGGASIFGDPIKPVDPQCADKPWKNKEGSPGGCGLGAELVVALFLVGRRWA